MSFGQHKIVQAVLGLTFAGATFIGMSMVLVVPALLGATNGLLLFIAALIVGIQAAQSSVIQVGRNLDSAFGGKPWLLIIPALLITFLGAWIATEPVVETVLATLSGALLGLLLGRSGLTILEGKGGAAFQSFQAYRTLGLLVAAGGAALVERGIPGVGATLATTAIGALALVQPRVGRRRAGYSKPEPFTKGAGISVTLGLLASLFYRNDVNWIRTALSTSQDFVIWHYALIAYSAVQGIVGFVVVQLFFAHRQQWRTRVAGWSRWFGLVIAFVWTCVVLAAFVFVPKFPVVSAVLCCALLALGVGFVSALAHVLETNWAPYIAGVLGASALSVLLALGVDPRTVLVLENAIIGTVIFLLIVFSRRR